MEKADHGNIAQMHAGRQPGARANLKANGLNFGNAKHGQPAGDHHGEWGQKVAGTDRLWPNPPKPPAD
jgi:hypothetical protein